VKASIHDVMRCGRHAVVVLADEHRHAEMGLTAGRLSRGNQRKMRHFQAISLHFPAFGSLRWQFFGLGRK
jgi:hypothetical protein